VKSPPPNSVVQTHAEVKKSPTKSVSESAETGKSAVNIKAEEKQKPSLEEKQRVVKKIVVEDDDEDLEETEPVAAVKKPAHLPSDQQIKDFLAELFKTADLDNMTKKIARGKIQEKFETQVLEYFNADKPEAGKYWDNMKDKLNTLTDEAIAKLG
jgi:hypothetical protein